MERLVPKNNNSHQLFSQYLYYNSYRSERYKLFYVANVKVACTTLKWWFADLEGYSKILRSTTESPETDPDLIIHDTFYKIAPEVAGLNSDEITNILSSDSYFKFTVVRNPFKRVFSAWQSKLLLKEPLQIAPYLKYDFFNRTIDCAEDIAMAFEGFLEHLASNEAPNFWDIHWTPQIKLLLPELVNYSKIFKIEDTKEFKETIVERFGNKIPDPFSTIRTNESLIPYLPELFTQRSCDLILKLYAGDFIAFGYDTNLPESKEVFTDSQIQIAIKAIKLIRGRNQRVGEKNVYINSLIQKSLIQEQIISQKDEELKQKKEELSQKDENLKLERANYDKIASSVIWRMTKPIRVIQLYSLRVWQVLAYPYVRIKNLLKNNK